MKDRRSFLKKLFLPLITPYVAPAVVENMLIKPVPSDPLISLNGSGCYTGSPNILVTNGSGILCSG